MTNKIYFNEIYLHFGSMIFIFLYVFLSCIYILFNDDYNMFLRLFVIFVIADAIYLSIKRDTFLPFLGISFIPNNLIISEKIPKGANVEYVLDMTGYEDSTRVIYWAANKTGKIIEDPLSAYKDFENVGVAYVHNGKAIIKVFCPDKYKVNSFMGMFDGGKKTVDKHFHYRIIFNDTGLSSPVMTAKLNC